MPATPSSPTAAPTRPPTPGAPGAGAAGGPGGAGGAGGAGEAGGAGGGRHRETIKETLVSIIIAFVLAFVFRGFVVEAFVIPTGSMAPTLMGAHMRFRGSESGYTWPVGPWQETPGVPGDYRPIQTNITVHDPMTGQRVHQEAVPRRSGDRILVLKFLYGLREPERFDVVVFKCPYEPATNFIKRLIGLPGEQVALIDGDVFTRPAGPGEGGPGVADAGAWSRPGWRIARKPVPVQEAVWQAVFDSRYAPLNPLRDGRPWYNPPWVGTTPGWKVEGPIYTYEAPSSPPTRLEWDATRPRYSDPLPPWSVTERWEIDDRYPYNENAIPSGGPWQARFPVSDVRMRAGIEPMGPGLEVTATVAARGHEFEAVIRGGTATLRMRGSASSTSPAVGWRDLATAAIDPLPPGRVTDVEFWHVDQSLSLWVGGRPVVRAEYDWTPDERVRNTYGKSVAALLEEERAMAARPGGRGPRGAPGVGNIFMAPAERPTGVRWSFSGAGLRMHRVGLDRDLYYQPWVFGPGSGAMAGKPALATHPTTTMALGADEFFVCGDNSPASKDGRLWDDVDPWARLIDDKPGVVPRDLMLGKAFFVYFPSLHKYGVVPVPDFGRLRFIR